MASTTQTTNYGLPLYQSGDRPAWTDTNTPFESLDTAVKTASDNASSAADAITTLTTALSTLNQTVSGHTTQLSTLETNVASAATAQGTSFTAHGLNTATDVQNAIQNAGTAAINSYDNTNSGLTAVNVQAALDEMVAGTQYEVIASATGDGSATIATDLASLWAAIDDISDIISNVERYVLFYKSSSFGSILNIVDVTSTVLRASRVEGTSDTISGLYVSIAADESNCHWLSSSTPIATGTTTYSDLASTPFASGRTLAIARRKY